MNPVIFIIYGFGLRFKTYKLDILDDDKCNIIFNKYAKITTENDKDKILDFADAMFNIFNSQNTKYYIDIINQFVSIDLSELNQIGISKKIKNNEINSIYPLKVYYLDFSDC